ncbi:hypothetical protein [Amphritea japonica]|uniref:DUF4129 domain-containing protein n=1 Tax=Amphritea japonica ATCC BAA-1530 TaxID=1278309 RepID=A0A7R6PB98_9GAMM|nr:hypothetical protein [Amphritea japonica]BBB25956.1 conserved hypothetical protein [Amphritea japonica ATCC BAA-1530]
MELDKLEINLRRRTSWEAIDLGFALARRWFMPLWLLWLASAAPLGVMLFLLLHEQLWLLILLVWWFKPLYEPPLMFWMSRAVFGEQLPVKSVLRQWWTVVRPQLLLNLTFRRFNPSRSFTLPVAILEQLRGKPRRDRLRVLGKNQHAATWLTVIGIHLETILETAFVAVVFMLIPEDLRWTSLNDLIFAPGRIGEWLQLAGGLLCMSLIAPFYVAAGFALYLNRRSELEGWDIEINFRRTRERLKMSRTQLADKGVGKYARKTARKGSASLILICLVSFLLPGSPAEAGAPVSSQEAKPVIEQVLEDDAFGRTEQTHYWQYIGQPDTDEKTDNSWFFDLLEGLFKILGGFFEGTAEVGKILIWIVGILLVVYLVYRVAGNTQWFSRFQRRPVRVSRQQPVELFGLDLRPEQLPDDLAAEAHRLASDGAFREALSLLYRGALVYLVMQAQLDIPDSATEGECLEMVKASRTVAEAEYFDSLTGHWLKMAYGHITPAAEPVLSLCERWPEVYSNVDG